MCFIVIPLFDSYSMIIYDNFRIIITYRCSLYIQLSTLFFSDKQL